MLAFSFSMWYDTSVVERQRADIAQSVERILGKDEVASSNLAISSTSSRDVVSMAPGLFCCHKLEISEAKIWLIFAKI